MANPVVVACPEGQWTKVATASLGQIWRKDVTPKYLMTYVMASDPAPTGLSLAVPVFINCDSMPISNNADIDVYLWPVGAAGEVIVAV